MACWYAQQRVGARVQAQPATDPAAVWERGEVPKGGRWVDTLPVEADGVWVHSRVGSGQAVKLGVADEGRAEGGRDRRALVGQPVDEASAMFWETAAAR